MQEIHSIGSGARFFGGGGGGGDRRLRPHSHSHGHHQNNHNQALKCPRCDSLNTKFCYYNNYNLSQPRHFCKNCRRYWTKGGVLRNVPVGGGCRKSKRSNKTTKTNSSTETLPQTTSSQQQPQDHNSNSHSSSESSNLTAATTTTTTTAAAAATTELNSDSSNNNNLQESKLLIHENNPALESGGALEQGTGDCGGIFSEIGTFTSLIASSSSSANNDALAFGFGGGVHDATSFQWQNHKFPENLDGGCGSLLDHGQGTVTVDLSALQSKTGHGGFGALDWQGGADQGLFDLPNAVDHAYWSQTQWSDQDNSALFHLP